MAFSDEVVHKAWHKAGGICKCERTTHSHYGICHRELKWEQRGREGLGAWEAHHIGNPIDDSLSNCEILYWTCHKLTI